MNPFVNKWPKDIWKYEYSMATCLHYLASRISGAYFIRFGALCATSLLGRGVRPTLAERLLSYDALNTWNSLRKLLKIRTFIQRFIKLHQYFSHVPIHGSWLWPNVLLRNCWESSFYTWQLSGKLDRVAMFCWGPFWCNSNIWQNPPIHQSHLNFWKKLCDFEVIWYWECPKWMGLHLPKQPYPLCPTNPPPPIGSSTF